MIEINIQLSPKDLLQAAKQLNADEFSRFLDALLTHRAQQSAPVLSEAEATLLQKIQRGLPVEMQTEFEHLRQKQEDETLTTSELTQLKQLNQQIESFNVERTTHLVQLAQLRQVPLAQLMVDLGLNNPTDE